jgi:hypothetical protein
MAFLHPGFLRRFRFVVSKDFFVSWGISFGFLLGIFSGLAQLLPDLKLSLQASFGLIAGSALIGIVYAYRKNRAVHLAVDNLLPDSPGVGPGLSLECSTERNAIIQVLDLAKRVYPEVDPPPVDRYQRFVTVNPALLVALFNSHREVVGYFDVYPMQSDFCDLLFKGLRGELDTRAEHILPPEEAWQAPRLYLAGLAVEGPKTAKGNKRAYILCWGLLKYLQHFYGGVSEREIFAEGVTEDGRVILRKFGFTLASPATGRKDPYPLYRATLNADFFSRVTANLPDWSNVCQLGWVKAGTRYDV